MFDNAFLAAVARDGDPDAAGLMMRDLSAGLWVEYDPFWPPECTDVVPLEVLLDDGDPDEPGGLLDGSDTYGAADPADTAGHVDAGGPLPVPAGVASMPPGPDLGTVLAGVPVRRVSGYDTVDVMTAAYRQAGHARAVFLAALLETGMRRPGSADSVSRVEHPGEFGAEEARAALAWSRRRADGTFELAFDIHERLPMLGEAMYAGVLDEPRARAFTQWTTGLADDQAAHIIGRLLPVAGGLLVGVLIDRIKRLAIAIDPGWAERRYRQAVKGRRVEGSRNDDGTANIAGLDLPVDRAAAACDRIDTLARACKHAGNGRPINHIRADLYLGMLDGTFEHLTEDEIIAHVLTHPFTDEPDGDGPGGEPGHGDGDDLSGGTGDNGSNGDAGPSHGGPDGHDGGPGGGPGGGAGSDHGGGGAGLAGSHDAGDGDGDTARPNTGTGTGTGTGHDRGGGSERGGCPAGGNGVAHTREHVSGWSVRELRVELAALLGANDHPAEIAGWDFVPVALARTLITTMRGAQWRWVICDRQGRPIDTGITRRRPHPPPGGPGTGAGGPAPPVPRDTGPPSGRRAGIVELQIRADELPRLAAAAATATGAGAGAEGRRAWAGVIADIATQHHASTDTGTAGEDADVTEAADKDAANAADVADGAGAGDAAAARDAYRRSARAGLRRAIQIRDRHCVHPSCRAPASRTDQDHATDHADGGSTIDANLGSACRHDHRVKHDGGWRISKPAPDVTVWASPLGHTYVNRPPPIMPTIPKPWPAADTTLPAAAPSPAQVTPPARTINPTTEAPPF